MERQIYDLETDYLTGTEWGNALVGWAPLEEAASIVRRPTARGRAQTAIEAEWGDEFFQRGKDRGASFTMRMTDCGTTRAVSRYDSNQ